MNIIITLPHELCEEILIGHKIYEARKAIPRDFEIENDRVYMVEKGSNNVVGFFTIAEFCSITPSPRNLDNIKVGCCVSSEYLYKYYRHYDKAILWRIRSYFRFARPLSLSRMFDKDKAPQSYFYTNEDWGPSVRSVNAIKRYV